jgi:hypothetical protein
VLEDRTAIVPTYDVPPQWWKRSGPLYSLVDRMARAGLYVVHAQLREANYYVVDDERTGHTFNLGSRPDASPDGKRLAAIGSWGEGGGPTLEVWRLDPGGPVLEYSRVAEDPNPYGPWEIFTPVGWEDDSSLRYNHERLTESGGRIRSDQRLVRTADGWRVEE